jgi:CheY-like chemotaxis protein
LFYSCGAAVHTAGSPEQAEAMLESGLEPDLALVDYRLGGGLDGLAVARRLARLATRPFPVLIVTGDTEAADIRRLQAAGMGVIYKPLAGEALLAMAGEAIAGHATS